MISNGLRSVESSRFARSNKRASELAGRIVAYREQSKQPNILEKLTAQERARVLRRAAPQKFLVDAPVFSQGERQTRVFIIDSGLIRTFYVSPSGHEITLAYWKPGNIVGTPHVLGTGINMWSGVTTEESHLLAFRSSDLQILMREIPSLAIAFVEALEFKGKCLSALVQMLGTRAVSDRLALLLSNLSETHGVREKDGISIGSPFTHEVLAQMVGASRQWVTVTLDEFQRQGLIRIGKCKTTILTPSGRKSLLRD